MGATTCKNCSLTTIFDKNSELDLKIEYTHEIKSTPQAKNYDELRKIVPRLKALWQGHTMRKLFLHLLRQSRPNHLYFSKTEVFETLSSEGSSLTKRYGNHTYKSGGIYIGEWLGGFRHGYGSMIWPDGAKYEGNWSYGRPLGLGKFVHVDNEIYNDKWIKYWVFPRDIFSSNGNYEKLKDSANDGYLWLWIKHELFKVEPPEQRRNSSVTKERKHTKNDNSEQIKDVKNRVEFIVRKISELKQEYKILSSNDVRNQRQFSHESGIVYIGGWKDNKKKGFGKQIWTTGDVYEGAWLSDKQHGLGKHQWSTGNSYFGQFEYDQKEGLGEYYWKDGSFYIGEWKRNKMHGFGRHKWDDGKEYIGEWSNGAREGLGLMIYKNGSKYEGNFLHDRPHGYGVLYEAEGRILQGYWENGKFIDPA
ncbi:hypothetical protein SteCoe_31178 [Stentor coeruleus]|uniref:MORN repeat protein n=1 Tax=Stentor coeruleus TaxID=5963 RepID=A0A1R2B1X7_9CILI|nr:hypothetical protein SteCoe_31178 [Stentor coeruleus]